ncbi:MAG TPA: bifunctional oligoribonuclease/PAP phosphatase NrnA [Candidatus Limnocylindria bacterium]|nr:bifunctional oligoribonuclease/PAP phosphatase NrnA [Candidatus Limnocylindria bacterium]
MLDVAEVLRGAQRISAFCHENPDGDTLGAAIAIAMAAERLGKEAEVVSVDPPPPFLAFLPGVERVRRRPGLEPDVAVVVDAGELSRIGSVATEEADWFARARIVNIDHHVSNPGYGEAVWIDPEAAATCELVTLLLPELGVSLDAQLATALMAGIVQDTHTFAHPNATARTLRVAAELVEAGAPLAAINRAVYADKPFSTLALWGLMLAGIGQRAGGRIVYASMTAAMLASTGEQPTASEGFVDLLGSTRLADVTILFKEVGPQETRVSVRTSALADAVAIASAFGGGGHPRAAGCTLQSGLEDAREPVLAEAERELVRGDARGR